MSNEKRKVVIPEPQSTLIEIVLEGFSPYIPHSIGEKAKQTIRIKQQKLPSETGGKKARLPQEEYEECFYRTKKGNFAIPVCGFKRSMRSATATIDNVNGTNIKRGVYIQGIPSDTNRPVVPLNDYTEPWMREDMVGLSGARKTYDLRYRPQFDKWSVTLLVDIDETEISVDQFMTVLQKAGRCVGIGDWRQECEGDFGHYRIKSAEQINTKLMDKAISKMKESA